MTWPKEYPDPVEAHRGLMHDRSEASCRAPGGRCVDMQDCYTSKGCQFEPDDSEAGTALVDHYHALTGQPLIVNQAQFDFFKSRGIDTSKMRVSQMLPVR